MDLTHQIPLAAGLLTVLASSVTPTPTVLSTASPSWSHALPTLTPSPGNDNGDERGNVLISLALNIQRYAHIQIGKEWEHEKLRKELDWKRAQHGQAATVPYGAVDDIDQPQATGRHSADGDESTGRSGRNFYLQDENTNQEDQLNDSVLSDQTVRPENELRHGNRKSYLRSPYWWAGIVLMTIGEIGNFMAYGFAPASIVSPLGVAALISNCVIAPCLLKEKFRTRDFWGVVIAITGAVVVVLSAKSSEEKIGPHDIWVMITRWEFELYLGLTATLIVVLMWASGKYGSRTILIDVGLVGLFGGYTALSTKGVSSLLSGTWWHVITFPITYLLIFVLVFSALMQIRYINRALQRFDSTQVIPTQFVLFTLSVITGSAVLYRDFRSFTPSRATKFVGGCLLTFLGVYFITSGRVRADDESSYSAEDEEEAIGLLSGERYQDSVDLSPPPPRHSRVNNRVRPRSPELSNGGLQSPSGSLLSRDIEDVDENQATPRVALSAASASPVGSFAAESLSEPSPGSYSSSRAQSLLRNPWAESLEETPKTTQSIDPIKRPVTPPGQGLKAASSSMLLRFPPAPGADEASALIPTGTESTAAHLPHHTVPQTPPRRARNSISSRFSPGPLLPTLSAGFSAVIAESLLRGEVSPAKERRTPRRPGRKKLLSTTVIENIPRNPEGQGDSHGLNANPWNRDDSRLSLAAARLNSTGDLATAPVSTGELTPSVAPEDIRRNHSDGITTVSRLRSLSDSWSRGFSWLGGALHRQNASQKAPENVPTDEHRASVQVDRDDHRGL
ncbi:hypothetical protein AOCH_001453 [Aspergillus ochraceoroseus]|uniref:DUF803 domain membrane protein n=1 Tax=Aspergillus ochraceoroseus TaxID=138278 RepID=A0A0F8UXY5_9EURO|nr:hypothetical protein AOCH_001453 [Aspergillus ochraceoroseus]